MTQSRWLCRTCDREWIESANACGALPWAPSHGCPGCRSAQIDRLVYTPSFPGADIPRDGSHESIVLAVEPPDVVQAPPHVLMAHTDEADALAAQWEALARS